MVPRAPAGLPYARVCSPHKPLIGPARSQHFPEWLHGIHFWGHQQPCVGAAVAVLAASSPAELYEWPARRPLASSSAGKGT